MPGGAGKDGARLRPNNIQATVPAKNNSAIVFTARNFTPRIRPNSSTCAASHNKTSERNADLLYGARIS